MALPLPHRYLSIPPRDHPAPNSGTVRNNHAERVLRSGVLWRKNAFGCHSEGGCRFADRMLTVVQTLRLQKRPVLDYLYRAVVAYRSGTPAPALLLPQGD